MSDPRTHIDRDWDRSVCPPSDGTPPIDTDWYEVVDSVECEGLEDYPADEYEIESVDQTRCANALVEFDPAIYEHETVIGGDCEECCCCPCPCCCGSGYWTAYEITVEGFVGGFEGFCEAQNGAWTVEYAGDGLNGCRWSFDNGLPGAANVAFALTCNVATGEWVVSNFNTGADWESLDPTCECGGTLTHVIGSSEGCEAVPETITVEPAGEWVSCGKAEPDCAAFAAMRAAETPEQKAVRAAAHKARAAKAVGPGTELKKLLRELGLTAASGCGCEDRSRRMNRWGVAGCQERRAEIIDWLRSEQAKRGWFDKLKAAALAVASGLALKLDPLDPAPGLLDEALRRAEAQSAGANDIATGTPDTSK